MSFLCQSNFIMIFCTPSNIMFFFFFNDTATTEIYTLSLHDALPIWSAARHDRKHAPDRVQPAVVDVLAERAPRRRDRKSTRLNSSHMSISYAVFCLKKKKKHTKKSMSKYHPYE